MKCIIKYLHFYEPKFIGYRKKLCYVFIISISYVTTNEIENVLDYLCDLLQAFTYGYAVKKSIACFIESLRQKIVVFS